MAINATVIIFILLVFLTTRRYENNRYFRYLPYIVIFLFMAGRYDYGDGIAYRQMFDYLHYGMSVPGMKLEPLYSFLNRVLPSFSAVVVVTSLIYVLAFYIIISGALTLKQRSLALIFAVLHPYILMVDMSAIRQSVAIALLMVGVYLANKYKAVLYIPFCVVATLFHKSAIVLLPVFFLFLKRKLAVKIKVVIMGATFFFLLAPEKLFGIINSLLKLTGLNNANYLSYLNNGYGNSIQAVALSFVQLIFFMLCGDSVEEKNTIYVKLSVIAIVAELLQGCIQTLGRIQMYFLPFIVVSLPLILKRKEKTLKVQLFNKSYEIKNGNWIAEVCWIVVFIWKFVGFMTPRYAYRSVFTVW